MRSLQKTGSLTPYYLIPLIALATLPFAASDLSCWTALGLKSLASGTLQTADTFSVFATRPLVYPAWGASILYGLLYPYLGLAGLCALHWTVPILLLAWIYRRAVPKGASTPPIRLRFAIYLIWLGIIPAFGERPSTLALLLVAATYDRVSRLRLNSSWIPACWPLMALQVVWVNLHGSFIILPVMLGWRLLILGWIRLRRSKGIVRQESRPPFSLYLKSLGWLVAVSSAVLVNPFGWRAITYVFENAQISTARGISEWEHTLPWSDFPAGVLQYALAAGVIALFIYKHKQKRKWKSNRQTRFSTLILSSPFFPLLFLGFQAVRNTALPFLALLPFLSSHFRSFLLISGKRDEGRAFSGHTTSEHVSSPYGRIILTLVGIAAWIALWPPFKPYFRDILPASRRSIFAPAEVPLLVLQAIRDSRKSSCAVFAEIELGGALMLQVPNPVFMDTRNIIYSDADFELIRSILNAAPGWQRAIAAKNTCFIAVDRLRHPRLAQELIHERRWSFRMREEPIELFERKD